MLPIPLSKTALLVVDAQCGFSELCPEELPVPGALAIVGRINQLLAMAWKRIDASQDWHPPDHRSFYGQEDNLYPPHCVAGSRGAEFLPGLAERRFQTIWRKGFNRDFEAYAVTAQHPGLFELYRAEGIESVVIAGLASNICCFYAARDFRNTRFRVLLVEDASAGIDIPAAGLYQRQAKHDGQHLGIEYTTVKDVQDASAC